jgi:glycosyltransferase involved in cell wall biosynthesis
MPEEIELTIVMPCLNEAETLARCIEKAHAGLAAAGVRGEVLIADNGSTDGSIEIAERLGARVERVQAKGYGNALRGGIAAARGRWIIMGDSDDSYDFSNITGFVQRLRAGDDLVMGCRLPVGGGTIKPGAMPWKNRWLGNPVLSFLGRLFFKTPIHDFHCGMRGFSAEGYRKMDLKTTGMEFASEMVMKATIKGLRVSEVPITLHKDGRNRPPHLKPWRDGWRHLRFMLIYSPKWLFLVPGIILILAGLFAMALTGFRPLDVGGVRLDVGTLLAGGLWTVLGVQLVSLAFFTKVFAVGEGLLNADADFTRLFRRFNLERGLVAGLAISVIGVAIFIRALAIWQQAHFGAIDYAENLRRLIPAATLCIIGLQVISASFFLSVLGLKTGVRTPPGSEILNASKP